MLLYNFYVKPIKNLTIMAKIINNENKKLVKFLTDEQKDLIARLEKGEHFDLRNVECDLLFGLPAGIRQPAFLTIISQGCGGGVWGKYNEEDVGFENDYRLCELPVEERKVIFPKYVERCAIYRENFPEIFKFPQEEYIPVLQVYISQRNLPLEGWKRLINLPKEEIIEIMAHALVLSNFAPHVLKDLAKLPIRQQDEIRAKATTIANDKKKK